MRRHYVVAYATHTNGGYEHHEEDAAPNRTMSGVDRMQGSRAAMKVEYRNIG